MDSKRRIKKNNANHCNKDCGFSCCNCPYNCCGCRSLGEYVRSRYEVTNMWAENGDSIFSPELENTTFDYYGPRKGQLFINAEFIAKSLGNAFTDIIKGSAKNVY